MKVKILKSLFFITLMVGLQQLSFWLGEKQPTFKLQKAMIIREEMDPSLIFYTESEHALIAEKKMRKAIN